MTNKVFLPFVLAFFIALLGALLLVVSFETAVGSDLISFLTGALILRDGAGGALYDYQTQLEYQREITRPVIENWVLPYHNIPILAYTLIPLTYLPLLSAYKIFVLFLIFVAVLISYFSQKFFKNVTLKSFWMLLPFLYYPGLGSIFVAQTSLFFTLILLLALFFLKSKKEFLAGILTSLLFLKIQHVIFMGYIIFLINKKKEYIKGFIFGSLFLLITSIYLTKGSFITSYFPYLFSLQKPEFGIRVNEMFTLHAFFSQTSPLSQFTYNTLFFINFLLYFASIGVFWILSKKVSYDMAYAAAIILTLVFSVHGLNHDLSLLLIPIFILVDKLVSNKRTSALENAATLLILILIPSLDFLNKSRYISLFLLISLVFILKPERIFSKKGA